MSNWTVKGNVIVFKEPKVKKKVKKERIEHDPRYLRSILDEREGIRLQLKEFLN